MTDICKVAEMYHKLKVAGVVVTDCLIPVDSCGGGFYSFYKNDAGIDRAVMTSGTFDEAVFMAWGWAIANGVLSDD